MKKKQKLEGNNLPHDMIADVLSRLPAKSLYRFRCVCRSWCSLICPHFLGHQENIFLLFNKYQYSILNFHEATSDSNANGIIVMLMSLFDESTTPKHLISLLTNVYQVHASCPSWLLCSNPQNPSGNLLLFNPYSREYKEFARHPFTSCSSFYHDLWGICYDSVIKDYKVVSIGHGTSYSSFLFTVFSFKSNSWAKIREFPYSIADNINQQGISVNGAPHWVASTDDRRVITRFDLEEEKFIEVPSECFCDCFSIAAIRGNLFAYCKGYFALTIWEMQQYGVKESWSQVCRIEIDIPMASRHLAYRMKPMAFTKKGEVIIAVGKEELLIYNLENKMYKTLMTFEEPMEWTMAMCSLTRNCDCWDQEGSTSGTQTKNAQKED